MKANRTFQVALAAAALGVVMLGTRFQQVQAHPDYGCDSCHVPHNASSDLSVPLWNPDQQTTTLTDHYAGASVADGGSLNATLGAVDGASLLCVSCHDGSNTHVHAEHVFSSLANTHPVSFVFDSDLATADGELVDPSTLAPDVLDINSKMQCSSCHDVHGTTPTEEFNLRWDYSSGPNKAAFCRNCHAK